MVLSEQEEKDARAQLLAQVQELPEEKRAEAERMITTMSRESLTTMVEQQRSRSQIFRRIAAKEVESVIIEEGKEAIAVLEIRPLSKGHTLVVPLKEVHTKNDLPQSVLDFARGVAEKIKDTLQPQRVIVRAETKLGEVVVELIPEYGAPVDERAEREMAATDELEAVAKQIHTEIVKKSKPAPAPAPTVAASASPAEVLVKLRRRIP